MRFLLLLLAWTYSLALVAQNSLIINELMQSNVDCVMDDLNDFPDSWVELYNPSSDSVTLGDYSIGLTRNASSAWQLPHHMVAAGGRTMVWCDKESKQKHTDFRLESGKGGAVYLFKNGLVVDSVCGLKKQPSPNIAYGRQTDGSNVWGYQAEPTPYAPNCGTICAQVLGDPVFSVVGQVFSSPTVDVMISVPDDAPAGTVVRYTTDGSEPTESSPVYNGRHRFANSRVVRAKLFCEGYLSPRAVTQSYILLNRAVNLPVVSIVGDNRYFYDNQIGILADGSDSNDKNYNHNWRRPINLELFENQDEESVINQLCETRVTGNASRSFPLKSLAVYANKRFGKKRFEYAFFPDQRPDQTDYKSFILRNAGNDFDYLYMRDAIIQRSMGMYQDVDWQAWRPAIVLINGVYKGILNIRERSNEDNIYTNYGGLEDITLVENWGGIKEGYWSHWEAFASFMHTKNHTWQEYQQMLDCEEYINVMICELFFMNQDFPGNNIVYWRPNQASDSLPARWRLLLKDTDFGLGLYGGKYTADFNMLAWMYDPNYDPDRTWANSYEQTRMFRYAMQNADFQREFVDRAAVYMGDFLNFERLWPEIWQPMYSAITSEYSGYHRPLYNKWWPVYADELYAAKLWLTRRPEFFVQHIAQQYGLGAPTPMRINQDLAEADTAGMRVFFNDIPLTRPVWNGRFFKNRAIRLRAEGEALTVTQWEVRFTDNDGKIRTEKHAGSELQLTIPDNCKLLTVNAIAEHATGFEQLPSTAVKKIWRDGRIYIVRGGKTYDIMGREQ